MVLLIALYSVSDVSLYMPKLFEEMILAMDTMRWLHVVNVFVLCDFLIEDKTHNMCLV